MEEEISFYLEDAEASMNKTVTHTLNEFAKIRAGKANPIMLKGVTVEYYGSMTPLDQIANVSAPDARTLMVKPWEKGTLQDIERAIINSDLGLNPQNDGETIHMNVPVLTEERRRGLVKQSKSEAENGKISIRSIRKETNAELKKLQKDGAPEDAVKDAEAIIQELTNKFSKALDDLFIKKEVEIMTI
jgi:ribosome recycling factor